MDHPFRRGERDSNYWSRRGAIFFVSRKETHNLKMEGHRFAYLSDVIVSFALRLYDSFLGGEMNAIKLGSVIIGNALIWGAVIIGTSLKLKGTGGYDEISNILVVGSLMTSFLIFSGSLPFKGQKKAETKSEEADEKS